MIFAERQGSGMFVHARSGRTRRHQVLLASDELHVAFSGEPALDASTGRITIPTTLPSQPRKRSRH
jgi:hypothetical protein